MAHIKTTKGLDIPITGRPKSLIVDPLIGSGEAIPASPFHLFLDLTPFDGVRFKVLVKAREPVKIGQPLVEDKSTPGRLFCSPAGGVVQEVKRGHKRTLYGMIIERANHEEHVAYPPIQPKEATREEIIERLKIGGAFAFIRSRPFNFLANPAKTPRSIFVKALESAPFVPPAELQVEGHEQEFQTGLDALSKLTKHVHLIYRTGSTNRTFTEAKNVQKHDAEGPHPISSPSLHIQCIDPIQSPEDIVWTLNTHDVILIGHLLQHGRYYTERVIGIGGPGIISGRTGYFRIRSGLPISHLISGRIEKNGPLRFISGDPLLGHKVESTDFLGFYDHAFCVIPENTEREFLHFFRLGSRKYSFSKTYLSGHLSNSDREYAFTTNQHGEHRAFVDGTLYDQVMPLPIQTMQLVKAVMAEDFERAEQLGLLGVDSEDFALPSFVCPSKIEMTEIIKRGIKQYAQEVLA